MKKLIEMIAVMGVLAGMAAMGAGALLIETWKLSAVSLFGGLALIGVSGKALEAAGDNE